jgi:hypothetical protein
LRKTDERAAADAVVGRVDVLVARIIELLGLGLDQDVLVDTSP